MTGGNIDDGFIGRGYVRGPAVIVEGRVLIALAAFLRQNRPAWDQTAAAFAVVGDLSTISLFDSVMTAAVLAERQSARASDPSSAGLPQAEPVPSSVAMTVGTASGLVQVSERRIRQLLTAGRLFGVRVAGRWAIDSASVEAYLAEKNR